ncbi:MAG TPA: hypothetical protein VKV96_01915 [Roseiarcus sp.]|nr:hypothetical protein [Roseiarcus sp.]
MNTNDDKRRDNHAPANIAVPEALKNLHPRVTGWFAQHKREQIERAHENKKYKGEFWRPSKAPLGDLTERDLYRFKVTSAVFAAVEKAGGKIEGAPISGKVAFLISGRRVECSIVEKMKQSLRRPEDRTKWTAYPEHHQSGLTSSGFLRVAITTYIRRNVPEWVETSKTTIFDYLPQIVSTIMEAGPILLEWERERAEESRRRQEESAKREERLRLKELEERRWTRFREAAANWEERTALVIFIAELQHRLEGDGDLQVGARLLSEWIAWAQDKADRLDPLRSGLSEFFGTISGAS